MADSFYFLCFSKLKNIITFLFHSMRNKHSMSRVWIEFFILATFFLAAHPLLAHEQIIVSGGPALRFHEKYKANTHDRHWGNFVDAAMLRVAEIKTTIPQNDTITWMVYKPAYETRSKEEKEDLINIIIQKANTSNVHLVWFSNRQELLDYLNADRSTNHKIARLEYFGHSNKRTLMFDYSNDLDGASAEPSMLHILNLNRIRRDDFTATPYCKSWGCHSGEQFSSAWYKATGRRMYGAIGKTDYAKGGLPVLSTSQGRWSE